MWSYTNTLTTDTPGGLAWVKMGEVKHNYLPQVIIAEDFDSVWLKYLEVYNACHPEDFLTEMQEEVYRRVEVVTGRNIRPVK
jgi:putative aldouronate transport system substrate-binding protein